MLNVVNKSIQLKDGREISIETGKLAKQADGSVVVRMGDCMLLATAVSAHEAREGTDFLPLSVDYQEKFASAGKIPGGFLKREGRLSDSEILVCRLVDRAIRPLFPEDYHAETQLFIQMISADKNVQPDALADTPIFNDIIEKTDKLKSEQKKYSITVLGYTDRETDDISEANIDSLNI